MPARASPSEALGWLASQQERIRTLNFAALLLCVFALLVALSSPRGDKTAQAQYLALRDNIPGEVARRHDQFLTIHSFIRWALADQLGPLAVSTNLPDMPRVRPAYGIKESSYRALSGEETLGDVLRYLEAFHVVLLIDRRIVADDDALARLAAWRASPVDGEPPAFAHARYEDPWAARPRMAMWVCYERRPDACESAMRSRDLATVAQLASRPGGDILVVAATLEREERRLTLSPAFLERNTGALAADLDRLGGLKLEAVGEALFRPASDAWPGRAIPFLDFEVPERLFTAILIATIVLVQVYLLYEISYMAGYARSLLRAWPDATGFLAPWMGGRPGRLDLALTILFTAVLPSAALFTLLREVLLSTLPALASGYDVEGFARVIGGGLGWLETIAAGVATMIFFAASLGVVIDADDARRLARHPPAAAGQGEAGNEAGAAVAAEAPPDGARTGDRSTDRSAG